MSGISKPKVQHHNVSIIFAYLLFAYCLSNQLTPNRNAAETAMPSRGYCLAQEDGGYTASKQRCQRAGRRKAQPISIKSGNNRQEQTAGKDGISDKQCLDDARH